MGQYSLYKPEMQHGQIWRALDALAARKGLTPSGLARAAGLDATAFNKSKRVTPDGRPRWPSSESILKALDAAESDMDEFAALFAGRSGGAGRAIPIVGMARAGADGFFDEAGFPVGAGETLRFPDLGEDRVYALEIAGDSMEPLFRAGDIVVVQPGAAVRRGDRVVVRTRAGEMMAKVLGRKNDQTVELISVNPAYAARELSTADVDWIARIVWASQ
jgi:phage repressor protein C with HTH and peptisase S24 domain